MKGLFIEMEKLKRIAAASVAVAITAAAFSGCASSTDYSMTADGEKINAGVYINYILSEITTQMYTMYYSGELTDADKIFETEIDGKDFKTYIKDTAIDDTKELAAVRAKFDELGLELSEDDIAAIDNSVSGAWEQSGEFYEYEGISKESIRQYYEHSYKRSAIFDYYYDEGGIEEVSADEIQKYVNDNYIRYKSISVAKSTAENESAKETENNEIKELLDGYLAEAENLDFAGFDTIIDEYAEYQESQNEEDVSDTDSEGAVTELDSQNDSAADSDTSDETENIGSTDDSEADTELNGDSSDSGATDSDVDGETEEEEEDPHKNETVTNYTNATDSEADGYSEVYAEMLKEFKSAEYGKAAIYENDTYYYLYMTADISERTDYTEDNHDTLLNNIKGDDFDALVKSWVESVNFVVNDKAVKRYTVQEVYDRQNKYYSENS